MSQESPKLKSLPHESATLHVTGQAKYTGDFTSQKNLLHAWPVQSTETHAKILKLDATPALAIPGVVATLSSQDVPGLNDTGPVRHDEALFPSVVMHHGQAVAWVLAENIEAARAGAKVVLVEYQTLPATLGIQAAIAKKSFHTEPLKILRGQPEKEFANNPHVLTGEIHIGGQDHFYLETQVSQAHQDENAQMIVHSSTQHPSETQAIVAHVLGWSRNRVTVQSLRMGGGFGGKETQANFGAAIAALGALKTGRAVQVRLTRHQDMQQTGKRHPMLGKFQVGFEDTGKIQALNLEIFADGGWSLDLSEAIVSRAMFHCDNSYYIPHLCVTGQVCKTNVTSHTAFRGFGGPQGMLMIEEVISRIAQTLALPAEQVRQNNFYTHTTATTHTTHYGQEIQHVRVQTLWQELLASSQFAERQSEIENFNRNHIHTKRGLAITPVKFGISFTTTFLNQAGALLLIYADGSLQLNHGGTEMGQGLHTKMQHIAAQIFGLERADIRIMPTRTDKVPNTSATAASAGTDLNGAAVKNACETLRQRLAIVAAKMLNSEPEEIVFTNREVLTDPNNKTTWEKVVSQAYLERVQLSATGFYATPEIYYDKVLGKGNPFKYFAWGVAASETEIDTLTGMWKLRRVDILHDCGDSINPLIDKGQVEGGFVQGMGWLTMEELIWDDTGRLKTFAPSTYKIPTLSDVPADFFVQLATRPKEDKGAVLGSKAVGEPPLMLAISVREAIKDAIFSIAKKPVELASPATPEAILWAIEKQNQ